MRRALPIVLALTAGGCFTLDFDGDGVIDRPPPAGYETDELSCANGRDDDQDGRIDCQDSDCLMNGHCGEQIPLTPPLGVENTFELCSNGIDDDEDGQFDCGDRGCQAIMELCCLTEVDDETCSNGIDDDGNGFADCQDFSCRNNDFVTVCERERDCSNGLDDDGDRFADCRDDDCDDDPACSLEICDNGVDDDMDGLRDCFDPGCQGTPSCPPEADCGDMVDDNGNGRTDCADPSCYDAPRCQGPEHTLELCSDGNDNDGNGFTDCGDFSCTMESRGATPAAVMFCASRPDENCTNGEDDDADGNTDCADRDCSSDPSCGQERTMAECTNGIDDDFDGFPDCEDFSCNDVGSGADPAVAAFCADAQESTLAECMDGEDNDSDGFTDCGDFSCSRDGDPDAVEFCALTSETTFERCIDGVDNDENGFTDCADFSCRFQTFVLGTRFCDGPADCPSPTQCLEGVCGAPCNSDPDCPSGWTCDRVSAGGGFRNLCRQHCTADADCPAGDSCFDGQCLSIRGPCAESVFANEDSNFQEGSAVQAATCAEQAAMSVRSCMDGRDGDRDGFTDCEDWECNHNPRAVAVPDGMTYDDCFEETEPGSVVCTPARNPDGTRVCPPLCRYAGGRTCVIGERAGQPCTSDDDCGASLSCSRPGPAGSEFVCP
ncbi:MAG: hypothetical protein VYE22_27575 [Myxococcota bacterium]|nr:hypothetical protein [Myxococcota bacterium]